MENFNRLLDYFDTGWRWLLTGSFRSPRRKELLRVVTKHLVLLPSLGQVITIGQARLEGIVYHNKNAALVFDGDSNRAFAIIVQKPKGGFAAIWIK